eukprot:3735757-Amphidinium_carterae.1
MATVRNIAKHTGTKCCTRVFTLEGCWHAWDGCRFHHIHGTTALGIALQIQSTLMTHLTFRWTEKAHYTTWHHEWRRTQALRSSARIEELETLAPGLSQALENIDWVPGSVPYRGHVCMSGTLP